MRTSARRRRDSTFPSQRDRLDLTRRGLQACRLVGKAREARSSSDRRSYAKACYFRADKNQSIKKSPTHPVTALYEVFCTFATAA